ncbi:hypothetical protein FA10DRAFT_248806 [Acaromyces ingoldii]|uniref:Uncharacterized protein n=1 Tax=Acaromyces ingoldii TaxID=215250 RepID=A0A316Z1X9_9BASI|nr:hypothetical protein FA10DRAFT_248806 [Acaromyces ingoldii]PWN94195.1 hypothetical protein FA10DRAFT_248806 [Acaromyces ingoldii]
MRPTLNLFAKASRLPLNSKKANKDFYKGTGTGNIMRRKRLAVAIRTTGEQLYDEFDRPRTWNLMTHRLDEARIPSYIVPPGMADSRLRPLVFLGEKEDQGKGKDRPLPGYPMGHKMKARAGMDGAYYEQMREDIIERRDLRDASERDLSRAKTHK